jgi:hypothetical protein
LEFPYQFKFFGRKSWKKTKNPILGTTRGRGLKIAGENLKNYPLKIAKHFLKIASFKVLKKLKIECLRCYF